MENDELVDKLQEMIIGNPYKDAIFDKKDLNRLLLAVAISNLIAKKKLHSDPDLIRLLALYRNIK